MVTDTEDPLEKGLVYEGQLRLRWQIADADQRSADYQAQNARALHLMALLEDGGRETREGREQNTELLRIDTKLDVLLEAVSALLQQQQSLPRAIPVSLTPHKLHWQSAEQPPAEKPLIVHLYLSERYPAALQFIAQTHPSTVDGQVEVEFIGLDEETVNALEKFIFRQHRRKIAKQRHK